MQRLRRQPCGLTAAIIGTVASYGEAEQANFGTEAVLKTCFDAGVTATEVQNLSSKLEGITSPPKPHADQPRLVVKMDVAL